MAVRIFSAELVARTAAVERLLAPLTGTGTDRIRHVLVVGEAGVGKSRLLARAAELASDQGARVISGGCVSVGDATLPFAPYAEALRDLVARDGVGRVVALAGWGVRDLARLVPALGSDVPSEGTDPMNQLRLFEALHDLLRRLAAETPLVVQLEDMHWADAGALAATSFLFRAVRDEPINLVCSVRGAAKAPGVRSVAGSAAKASIIVRFASVNLGCHPGGNTSTAAR